MSVCVLLAFQADESKSKELVRLHRTHVMMFGEVRSGLGMQTLHLPADAPQRKAVIKMFDSLKVCGCTSPRSARVCARVCA